MILNRGWDGGGNEGGRKRGAECYHEEICVHSVPPRLAQVYLLW